jgi:hypothetical protein
MAMFSVSPARADLVDFIVNAGENLAAFIGQPIIFAGSAADPDNGIASVQWDFNYDGSNFDADPSANGTLMPLHTYGAPGTYQGALDATDNGGMSEIGTLTVTVTQVQSFVVEAGPSRSGSVGAQSCSRALRPIRALASPASNGILTTMGLNLFLRRQPMGN